MLHTIFDTETTGLVNRSRPHTDPVQPKIVQFAAAMYDDELDQVVSSVDLIVRPEYDGETWEIPEKAAAVHGITTETAYQRGLPLYIIADIAFELFALSDVLVAHNLSFDEILVRRALKMVADANDEAYIDPLKDKNTFCTMRASTNKVRIPKRSGGFKWPSLEECVRHFYGRSLVNAHNAMGDVNGTVEVYKALEFPINAYGDCVDA